ncbi:MAG: rod shape-determining protein MreD [Candidatus Firestonebacteria bacterium]
MFQKFFWMFICFLLQTSFTGFMAVGNAMPNFVIIGLVLIISKEGPGNGIKTGIVAGLFQDLISGAAFGTGLIVKVLDGFLIGLLKRQTFSDNLISKAAIGIIVTLSDGLASLLILYFTAGSFNIGGAFFLRVLPNALYTGIIIFVLLVAGSLFEPNSKKATRIYGV